MSLVGYCRVSTTDQSLDIQRDQLVQAGCDPIFEEKKTGTNADRKELQNCLKFLRNGDVLMVTRLDRLARSTKDMLSVMEQLEERGVGFKCLLQPVDTTSPAGRLFITLLGAFAQFETEVRKERQREGIDAAKQRGAYKQTRAADPAQVAALAATGMAPADIAKALKVSKRSVYRYAPGKFGPPIQEANTRRSAAKPKVKTARNHPPQHTLSVPSVAPKKPFLKFW